MQCCVRRYGCKNRKTYFVHRFVWECFNGVIPDEKVIDHISDNREDDYFSNLQIMTQQANCKKPAKNRDYSFAFNNHRKRKRVKATNINTQEEILFRGICCATKTWYKCWYY